jgi:putative ABC transport system substrate-binding protein
MKRIASLLLALALSGATSAQQGAPVIGYLGAESPERFASRLSAFRQGLSELGYVEGRNVTIEYRWANGDNSRLPQLASELVRQRVSVLVAPGSVASSIAAKNATSTIPVVFEMGADPVAIGLVETLNRPGGNVTGVTSLNVQLAPKRLELLRELVPGATSFALLVNPTNAANAEATTRLIQEMARTQKVQLHILRASTAGELGPAFEEMSRLKVGGLVLANDTFFIYSSKELADLALRKRIPTVHQPPEFVMAGGLISYAGNALQSHRLAGVHTGRVLKGEKPATLAVQQVNKMEMYVNVKTARALGLAVPQAVLVRADRVIE